MTSSRAPLRFRSSTVLTISLLPALLTLTLASPALPFGAAAAAAGVATPGRLDRVQLHGNGNRGVAYLPLANGRAPDGTSRLRARVIRTTQLDGDPLQNVYAGLRPIDVDGDGRFGFVHFNGTRFVQVWSPSGRKLWRAENPDGYLHDMKAGTRRDAAAVLDLDGDGGQDIAHCWTVGGRRSLVYRRGRDGAVIRSTPLGDNEPECEIAAFRVVGRDQPLILVAGLSRGRRRGCSHDWVGYWARTEAYDDRQRLVWARETCDAGHHAWPLDPERDGRTEAIFVGKYLLSPDGKVRCTLAGWPAGDHVDGMAIADFLRPRPGLEVVAAGRSGVAMFGAGDCRAIWRIPEVVIRNPQHLAAWLDTDAPAPLIAVEERGTMHGARTFVVDGSGRVSAVIRAGFMPMQNADLDGALGTDELVGSFGEVRDRFGRQRLATDWFWSLQGSKVVEMTAGPYPETYDRWQAFPLVFDVDRDGRDEIVQWGQSLIVVGEVAP